MATRRLLQGDRARRRRRVASKFDESAARPLEGSGSRGPRAVDGGSRGAHRRGRPTRRWSCRRPDRRPSPDMSPLRGLVHVAIAISDTEAALAYFRDRLGLAVTSSETIEFPAVRLTYLEAGGASLQLVEPLDPDTPI